jgi:hypothetical protein
MDVFPTKLKEHKLLLMQIPKTQVTTPIAERPNGVISQRSRGRLNYIK